MHGAAGGTEPLRVLVVTAVRLYRDGLASVLGDRPGLDVAGVAADHAECVDALEHLHPDVVLLDMTMPDSLGTVRAVASHAHGVPVVGLAVPELERDVVACAEAGVAGYVTREQSLDDVVTVLDSVARGETICSPRIAATLLRRVADLAAARGAPRPGGRLTTREAEIAALIDEGCSNKEIARRLCIEVPTVKNHVHNILEKLQASGRGEAAAMLRAQRLTSLGQVDQRI
jgi:two-component system nitrate/nitrite response regulator NarL